MLLRKDSGNRRRNTEIGELNVTNVLGRERLSLCKAAGHGCRHHDVDTAVGYGLAISIVDEIFLSRQAVVRKAVASSS